MDHCHSTLQQVSASVYLTPWTFAIPRCSKSASMYPALRTFTTLRFSEALLRCTLLYGTSPHYASHPRKTGNHSDVTEFLILGFSEFPDLQIHFFILFLFLYLMAVLGNLLIICIVCADPHLHTPMYFFLVNLSVLDISSLTVTVPKLLAILLTQSNLISFHECILQMFCFLSGPAVEFLLLTAMAYDRYVAICNPLRYTIIMNRRVCALLAGISWIAGFLDALPHYIIISQFSFCDSNVINHFFCDIRALLKLSCTDTSVITTITFVEEGKSKAFSTCSSHLTVLILSYGTILGVYMQPRSDDEDFMASEVDARMCQPFTQAELNNLVRDLDLPKSSAELLG
ncbi:olfactory receptor 1J4-like [Rhinatrema bivittatum]|uniref:olfactory receptor 1J4-like n=1 Tax=Rhinatrema bivittatum TaxID=194408 RepID=UPI001127CA17|nr:olfactory receptor 1J4-like [Rhinatrema bivittatum]